jgi:uncharacterized Zn-binding protein involved in type VI secretion
MPRVSSEIDVCRGHDSCAPRPLATASPTVEVEGIPVAREGDTLVAHGCPVHPAHSAAVTRGFATLEVDGRRVAYVGASVGCPSGAMSTGRTTVVVGE